MQRPMLVACALYALYALEGTASADPVAPSSTASPVAASPPAASAASSATPPPASPPVPSSPAPAATSSPTPANNATIAPIIAAPESPAFDAIGATPTTIARPTTVQALGAALLTTVDESGHVNAGIAIEAAPLWLLLGDTVTLSDWRAHYGARALSHLSVSFATLASASGVTEVSEGVRFVIWDDTDPRWDQELETCLVPALKSGLPPRNGGAAPPDDPAIPVVSDTSVAKCQADAKARYASIARASTAGAFSAAVSEQQDAAGNASLGKVFAWFSSSQNVGSGSRWLTVIESARYVFDNPGDDFDVGIRFRAGNTDLGIAIDGAWTPTVDSGGTFRGRAGVVGLDGELRLASGLWLSATAGGKFGADSGGAPDLFSVLHFKFATESVPVIGPGS